VVKEAMLCNLPVVSTDVGDVRARLVGVSPSAVVERDPEALANAASAMLVGGVRSNGRARAPEIDLGRTAEKTISFYREALALEGKVTS
jgi:glycosyltransferase involved in cell wall biosynthesis